MPESNDAILWEMETAFWLEGISHYRRNMSDDAVMVFPAPGGIMSSHGIYAALAEVPRWLNVSMSENQLIRFADDVAILAYRANASRSGSAYEALCSSTYLRTAGGWKLIQHQQTPIEAGL